MKDDFALPSNVLSASLDSLSDRVAGACYSGGFPNAPYDFLKMYRAFDCNYLLYPFRYFVRRDIAQLAPVQVDVQLSELVCVWGFHPVLRGTHFSFDLGCWMES